MSTPGAVAFRVLVTRPQPQADEWVVVLQQHGLQAHALPLIDIGPAPDPAAVREVWAALRPGALVMFVSPNAALQFFACLPEAAAWPAGVRAAATGPGTVAALVTAGVPAAAVVAPDATAGQFDSEALWTQLQEESWAGREVWVVRGEGGRDWFSQTLTQAGARVAFVQSYVRGAPVWSRAQQAIAEAALAEPGRAAWLLSSSEALDHLGELLPGADWSRVTALASHPRIEARAREQGFGRVIAVRPGWQAVVQALAGG